MAATIIGVAIAICLAFIAISIAASADQKTDDMNKEYKKHAHRVTPGDVATRCGPVAQDEADMERLIAALQNLDKQKTLDIKTLKGLLDAADES